MLKVNTQIVAIPEANPLIPSERLNAFARSKMHKEVKKKY